MNVRSGFTLLFLALLFVVAPEAAHAYGGPGSVISGIGAFLALLGALLASLLGFIWFPLKRLYKKMSGENEPENAPAESVEQ